MPPGSRAESFHSVNPAASNACDDVCTAWKGSGEELIKSIASRASGMYSSYWEERGGRVLIDACSSDDFDLAWLFCNGMGTKYEGPLLVAIGLTEDGTTHAAEARRPERNSNEDRLEKYIAIIYPVVDRAEIVCRLYERQRRTSS